MLAVEHLHAQGNRGAIALLVCGLPNPNATNTATPLMSEPITEYCPPPLSSILTHSRHPAHDPCPMA